MKLMHKISLMLLVWFGTTVQAAAQTGPGRMSQSDMMGGMMMNGSMMMGGPMMFVCILFALLIFVLLVLAILALVKYLRSERR